MYNKIKRELYATDCVCFEIKFYTADHLACFGCQECTKQLTRMMGFMPSDFAAVNSTLPTRAMIPNQPENFTRHDDRFNLSTIFSDCQIRQVYVSSRAIKRSDIHLEVLSSQNRKSFEYFLCFQAFLPKI